MKVGILALQGDFAAHHLRLSELGARAILVRRVEELEAVAGLVIPGGESTTLLRLLDPRFREALRTFALSGRPVLATCAGVILLAKAVTNPAQESLAALDVEVSRNAYGRQIQSFIDPDLRWTAKGREAVAKLDFGSAIAERSFEGVFIRAPRFTRLGPGVDSLAERSGVPVFVCERNIFAASFHPELSPEALSVHQLFLRSL